MSKIQEAIEKLERMKRNYLLSQNISFRIDWNEVQGVLDLLKDAKEESEQLRKFITKWDDLHESDCASLRDGYEEGCDPAGWYCDCDYPKERVQALKKDK